MVEVEGVDKGEEFGILGLDYLEDFLPGDGVEHVD